MTLCDEDAKVEPERDSDAQSVTLGEPLLVTLPEGLREPAVVSEYEGELVAVREREAQGVGDVEGLMVRDTVPLTVREPVEELGLEETHSEPVALPPAGDGDTVCDCEAVALALSQ